MGVDLIAEGTVFGGVSNLGNQIIQGYEQNWAVQTGVDPLWGPPVLADGVLAILTIDTTGVECGEYDLKLADTYGGDTTNFQSLESFDITITNGSILVEVIPEPSALVIWSLFGIMGASIVGWRRWRNS